MASAGERVLYLDCVGGVAGDMLLSALVGAAAKSAPVDELPARLGFDDVELIWSTPRPGGLTARHLEVCFSEAAHPRQRSLAEIEDLIVSTGLPQGVQETANRVFRRLAEAEAAVHGESLDRVHLHEVGAVDALIDVLGASIMVAELGIDEIVCSPLPMGRGTVRCTHGVLPLPAPAVAAMLEGVPVYPAGVEGETVTPTGAALVTTLAGRFGDMPALTVERVGVGGGSSHFPDLPNVVRAFVGSSARRSRPQRVENMVVECNVDDLDPRVVPVVIDRLLVAGAVDAFVTPVMMKKARPAFLISALAAAAAVEAVVAVMLRETTTLGCRTYPVAKHSLKRRMETVATPWGEVQVKVALLGDEELRRMPEFNDCLRVAEAAGVPVRDVLAAAGCRDHER
jgi:uncharacterized protein (TIGR00299 family) protein